MQAINVKERLKLAREKCPGMPEEVYLFADFLSEQMNEELVPTGVAMAIALALDEFRCGRAKRYEGSGAPATDGREIIRSARYVLQVIDAVTDKEFADEVRELCAKAFNWRPVRRTDVSLETKESFKKFFEPCIFPAADWWAGAIQLTDKTELAKGMPSMHKEFTTNEIFNFWYGICVQLHIELNRGNFVMFGTNYGPDRILHEAAERAHIDEDYYLYLFPAKTTMVVTPEKVEITSAYRKGPTVIWEAK